MKYRIVKIKDDDNYYLQKLNIFWWNFVLQEIGMGYFIWKPFESIQDCEEYIVKKHSEKPKLNFSILKEIKI